jgi:hypothetical protein
MAVGHGGCLGYFTGIAVSPVSAYPLDLRNSNCFEDIKHASKLLLDTAQEGTMILKVE